MPAKPLLRAAAGKFSKARAGCDPTVRSRFSKSQGLKRLAAHEARLRRGLRDALAHGRAPQRPDALQQEQAEPARALQRQEVRKEAAVEEIDREHAAHCVG